MTIFNSPDEAALYLGRSPPVALARDMTRRLPLDTMEAAIGQFALLLSDYYAHLPLKRSSLGIDPVREAEILFDEIKFIQTDSEFYRRLFEITCRLRDRHTQLFLPQPWRDMVAFLPFAIEVFSESGRKGLMVTKVMPGTDAPGFEVGVQISHWNGVPIRALVEKLSWSTQGANPYARIAIALRFLTTRPLAYMSPPDEDWVSLSFIDQEGNARSAVFPWRIHLPRVNRRSAIATAGALSEALTSGLDESILAANTTWNALYSAVGHSQKPGLDVNSSWLGSLRADIVEVHGKTCGYLRIFSFDAPDPLGFLQEVVRLLAKLPQDRLIIDVRANPGGSIIAGEGLINLFAKTPIARARLSFRCTKATRELAELPLFREWRTSLLIQTSTGETFSQGFSLPPGLDFPTGVYGGKVAVIIDALSYSTSDFFAAGMQDNRLATIIGVDPVTGAGGANGWDHDTLSYLLSDAGVRSAVQPIPHGMTVKFASRRSMRVGPSEGMPLEGLGVLPEHYYQLTREDVLNGNRGMIEFAAAVLMR